MTFNSSTRPVDLVEGLDLLQEAREYNLVQFGENVRKLVNVICNCCCEALPLFVFYLS